MRDPRFDTRHWIESGRRYEDERRKRDAAAQSESDERLREMNIATVVLGCLWGGGAVLFLLALVLAGGKA